MPLGELSIGFLIGIILLEFLVLALLGGTYLAVLKLHTCIQEQKEVWLAACRACAKTARMSRREASAIYDMPIDLPLGRPLKRFLRVLQWGLKGFNLVKLARY